MRVLVFNSKGGCGKSLITREVIAAPIAKKMVIAEIDELNRTQEPYKADFKDVIEVSKEDISELLIHLNEHENVVVDVGADNLTKTMDTLLEYSLFDDIDKVVIPMGRGRSDNENALKTYSVVSEHCKKVVFVFTKFDPEEPIEEQYKTFFKNVEKFIPKFGEKDYVTINQSDVFEDAQNEKILVTKLAQDIDHKSAAIAAKKDGKMDQFRDLMRKELNKRSAQILLKEVIEPAHKKIME